METKSSLPSGDFTPKDPTHFARGAAFRVVEAIDKVEFAKIGKKPAYRIERVGTGTQTLVPVEKFEEAWEPLVLTSN